MKKLWVVSLLAGMATSPHILASASGNIPDPSRAVTSAPAPLAPAAPAPAKAPAPAPAKAKAVAPTKAKAPVVNTQTEIADLKKRISQLEKQEDVNETRNYMIGSDMQFGVGSGTYADEVYIIDFGLNRDLSLLHERQYIHTKFKRFEDEPHLLISGNISGTAGSNSHIFGTTLGTHEQFMKAEAEMDFTAMINPDWLGYLEINGDAFGEDTGISIKQAFTTYGNFDKSPMYLTLGYQYVPFGNFTTNFIEATSVQDLGRIQVATATGAFNVVTTGNLEVNGAVFWFDGETKASEEFRLDEIGANLQMRQTKLGPKKDMSIMLGVSAVNNLASSNGIEGEVDNYLSSRLKHYIPAADARAKFIKGPFSLTAEYLAATRAFAETDFAQGQVGDELDGARPTATYIEAAYDQDVWKMPTTLSARWGQTQDALAFGLPFEEYGASYQLKPFFNTRVTFEYLHQIDYSQSTLVSANSGKSTITITGTGHTNDLFQAQVNVFF